MNYEFLLARLRTSEGWSALLYIDTKGYLTIGYGFNLGYLSLPPGISHRNVKIRPVNPLPKEIGETLLRMKVEETARELERYLPWIAQLDEVRREVLIDMAFNMGVMGTPDGKKGLVDGWPNFLRHVRHGEYGRAGKIMRGSKWRSDVHDRRAMPLTRMMETGIRE